MKKSDLEEKMQHMSDFRTIFIASIISALAFVVGLFWNDAIRSAIEMLIPQSQKVSAKFAAAIVVTIIVVVVSYAIVKTQKITDRYAKDFEKVVDKHKSSIKKHQETLRKTRSKIKGMIP